MKQKKQFCTYSGNVIWSKVYGLKQQKYLEKKANVMQNFLYQHNIYYLNQMCLIKRIFFPLACIGQGQFLMVLVSNGCKNFRLVSKNQGLYNRVSRNAGFYCLVCITHMVWILTTASLKICVFKQTILVNFNLNINFTQTLYKLILQLQELLLHSLKYFSSCPYKSLKQLFPECFTYFLIIVQRKE